MLLQIVPCPECEKPIGRILNGVAEFDCKKCKKRALYGVDVKAGGLVLLSVDKLPKQMPPSA